MTLHEAIRKILQDKGQPMTTQEIADQLNERDLYQKKDGTEIKRNQVSARINKYPRIFNLIDGRVSLVE